MAAPASLASGVLGPLQGFIAALAELEKAAKMARKHRLALVAENHYALKARTALGYLRRDLTVLRAEFSSGRNIDVSKQIDILADLAKDLSLEKGPIGILKSVADIRFHVESEVAAALHLMINNDVPHGAKFLPSEIVPQSIYRKILDEINRCYAVSCYNGCAALMRRLIESLIIEAFETYGLEGNIKSPGGEYLELKALIGKAIAEPRLKLSRNTKNSLPNLKLLGDLSVHGRKHFTLAGDLEKWHSDARIALQELASHLTMNVTNPLREGAS
jgi:hypothetical protein